MSKLPAAAEPLPETIPRPFARRAFARIKPHLPPSLQHAIERRPRLSGRQVFAVAVPVGLILGWLASHAVDPDILQHGGKPYSEVGADGVKVKLAGTGAAYDSLPEDPAPMGYGRAPRPEYLDAGIAEAGDYAGAAEQDAGELPAARPPAARPEVTDGQVLGEDPSPAPRAAAAKGTAAVPASQAAPQDTPL